MELSSQLEDLLNNSGLIKNSSKEGFYVVFFADSSDYSMLGRMVKLDVKIYDNEKEARDCSKKLKEFISLYKLTIKKLGEE